MKPELRVYLRRECLINPGPARPSTEALAFIAPFLPKLISAGIGGIATLLKKAGDAETDQVSGSELTDLFFADNDQRLSINPEIGCVLGIYGVFAARNERSGNADPVLQKLEGAGLVPKNAEVSIVFEAAVVPSSDQTAFHLETRYFRVFDFVSDRHKSDRVYVATFSVAAPDASADGKTIALGNVALGRLGKETLPIPAGLADGAYPRYHSNLMPWNRIARDAKAAYESDVRRDAAKSRRYMPVTFNLTLSETSDGNRFLAALGGLLEGAKTDAAKGITALVDPSAGAEQAEEDADAAEALLKKEEDTLVSLREAEAASRSGGAEQREVLDAKLARARRAHDAAARARKAAGLPGPE